MCSEKLKCCTLCLQNNLNGINEVLKYNVWYCSCFSTFRLLSFVYRKSLCSILLLCYVTLSHFMREMSSHVKAWRTESHVPHMSMCALALPQACWTSVARFTSSWSRRSANTCSSCPPTTSWRCAQATTARAASTSSSSPAANRAVTSRRMTCPRSLLKCPSLKIH